MNKDLSFVQIWDLRINIFSYDQLLNTIIDAINSNLKISISYANANTLNSIYKNSLLRDKLNQFEFIHPDGIGIYLAFRILFGKKRFVNRITGSDFYSILKNKLIVEQLSVFFFGHNQQTLNKIVERNPNLNIVGLNEGYKFNESDIIEKINSSHANILVVGLGFPLQEEWILKNRKRINCNVILSVGEGLKIFSKTKIRGFRFIRKIGLEWMVRLINNPLKYWKRYVIGNPLFLVRIINTKLGNLLR